MADYGSNAATQTYAYGAANTDEDARTTQARTAATAFINATLNRTTDIATPTKQITEACNLIAAAILTTSPENLQSNVWWIQGMNLLNSARGDAETDAIWGYNFSILRS